VIDTELVEDGGVEVVDVDGTGDEFFFGWIDSLSIRADDVVAVVVGCTVGHAGFDSAAGHPCGEAARMVIAAIVVLGEFALRVCGATKLSSPDD